MKFFFGRGTGVPRPTLEGGSAGEADAADALHGFAGVGDDGDGRFAVAGTARGGVDGLRLTLLDDSAEQTLLFGRGFVAVALVEVEEDAVEDFVGYAVGGGAAEAAGECCAVFV